MEALGRALVLEPYLATVVLGGGFLRLGGSAAQRRRSCPTSSSGKKTVAFAQPKGVALRSRRRRRPRPSRRRTAGCSTGENSSCCTATAPTLVVTARTRGGQRDRDGIGAVPGRRERRRRRAARLSDPGRPARRRHHVRRMSRSAPTPCSAIPRTALPLVERVADEATRRCAPRRSARWTNRSRPPSNT